MNFKLSYTIIDLDIHSEAPLILSMKNGNDIKIVITEDDKEGRKYASCDVIGTFSPTPKSRPIFTAILEGKRPQERQKANTAEDMVIHDGSCYGLQSYPNPFIEFNKKIYSELSIIATKAISYLRWRYKQEGPMDPIHFKGLSFSIDNNNNWHHLPCELSAQILNKATSSLYSEDVSLTELKNAIEHEYQEPLYHELLREAKELKYKSSRSSTLIAVSAAEIAVKEVIYTLAPKTQWLLENIQSPPVVKIIKDYFPKIIQEDQFNKIEPICENLTVELRAVISIRNNIAHRGAIPPSEERLDKIISTIEKLLWVCDYVSGNEWAFDNIDFEN